MVEELFRDDGYLRACDAQVTAVTDQGVRLNRTVFYPLGGGQPGDTGMLRSPDGSEFQVIDTRKDTDDIVHILAEGTTPPETGAQLQAEIDWERRHRYMRMHTCLHLLCASVEGDVTGGQIGDGKGRLDFNLPDTRVDKEELTAALNRLIDEDHPVSTQWITDEELDSQQELVRTMSVMPPRGVGRIRLLNIAGVDLQPCGGTHVARTGEIGEVLVRKIESKGKQNRRINIVFAGE